MYNYTCNYKFLCINTVSFNFIYFKSDNCDDRTGLTIIQIQFNAYIIKIKCLPLGVWGARSLALSAARPVRRIGHWSRGGARPQGAVRTALRRLVPRQLPTLVVRARLFRLFRALQRLILVTGHHQSYIMLTLCNQTRCNLTLC